MKYADWIKTKMEISKPMGFAVSTDDIHATLYPHQRDIVAWAVNGGRRALFERFGLGKTIQQLEILRLIRQQSIRDGIAGTFLIVCPLGVRQEFQRDAKLLGVSVAYVQTTVEAIASTADVIISNYERVRDGQIDVKAIGLIAVSLDEASVLRGYGTKTFQSFLQLFKDVPFRYVATATPNPNRFKELIHYAGYLGVMDTGEALTRFFQRDPKKANNLTLYPHRERDFWLWVSSWAVFLSKPSELGYSDEGYDLPEIHIHWHERPVSHTESVKVNRDGQQEMFRDASHDLSAAAAEKRSTMADRLGFAVSDIIAAEPDENWLVWHHLEDERDMLMDLLPEGAVDVYGTQPMDIREERVIGFSEGQYKYLVTKPEIAGSGCNFQRHCAREVFVGINYKFNDFIQAIHRIYRFMQSREVHVHIIYAESERAIRDALERKWAQHDEMQTRMREIVKEYGLSDRVIEETLARSGTVVRMEWKGAHFHIINNDCVIELASMPDNSAGLIVTSIPFGNHYEYTASLLDFGHNASLDTFFEQMDYLTENMHRVLQPGRLCCVHVKNRVQFARVTGYGAPTIDDFDALTRIHLRKHGFVTQAMITIETDVVSENNQTYRLGWTEQCKDGTKMGAGCPEYLLIMRKLPTDCSNGYADIPVGKTKADYTRARWQIDARAKWNSNGNRLLTPAEIAAMPVDGVARQFTEVMRRRIYDYDAHVDYAEALDSVDHLPAEYEVLKVPSRNQDHVWSDVIRMETLNLQQSNRRQEKHICPLQLDIVRRCIRRFSNPGDVVLDPFGGIGTVPMLAVEMGRYGIGVELNPMYARTAAEYCQRAESELDTPTLFDFAGIDLEMTV